MSWQQFVPLHYTKYCVCDMGAPTLKWTQPDVAQQLTSVSLAGAA